MSLTILTTPTPAGADYTLDVPAGWRQGRGAYGGFTIASLVRAIESERASMYDLVQRCYSDDGDGDGVLLFHAYEQVLRGLEGFNSVRDDETQRALRPRPRFCGHR